MNEENQRFMVFIKVQIKEEFAEQFFLTLRPPCLQMDSNKISLPKVWTG